MEATSSLPSVCPLDCPDTCSLSVDVKDNEITRVRGSSANPYTASVICEKVAKYYPEFVHGDARLHEPLRRIGARGDAQFEPISWPDALTLIAEKTQAAIDQYGPQTVLPFNYAGPHGQLAGGSMDLRFFHRLGASLLDRGPLCGGVRGKAYTSVFGNVPGMPPEQAQYADVIAVWGNNATVSNLHFARVVKQARERGARLIVVDPKRTRIAEQAHLFVQLKPGTDVVLAQALAAELERRGAFNDAFIKQWVEGVDSYMAQARQYSLADAARLCGLDLSIVTELVDTYMSAKTLAVSVGNGMERGKSGGSSLRAIMAASALLGQIGRLGAGIIAKPGFAFPTTPAQLQRTDWVREGTRTINIVDVGRHLLHDDLDPPLRSVFIYNHNPVATHPDQNRMISALSREEIFLTGIDVVMTDSMRFCDVVLPASSHFEFKDIYAAYGHNYLQRAEPVIKPVGNSLPNTEIFRRLASVFGYTDAAFSDSDDALIDAAIDGSDLRLPGGAPHTFPVDEALMMHASNQEPIQMCVNVHPATPSGKIELFSAELEEQYGFGTPRFAPAVQDRPFTVISPSSSKRTNATFGNVSDNQGLEWFEIHPQDAENANIRHGDLVKLHNDHGEVVLKAKPSKSVRQGVLYTPKGTWLSTSPTGRTVNALLSADIKTDIVDGACYNETFVDLTVVQRLT